MSQHAIGSSGFAQDHEGLVVGWQPLQDCLARAPEALLPWLSEPGLLTERVRKVCGAATNLRLLRLTPSPLETALRQRMQVEDAGCLLREIEIACGERRWVYASSVFPDSTVEKFPWLRELGHSGLGESLSEAGGVKREAFEYLPLPEQHELALAAEPGGASGHLLWARRAVYRLEGWPILVQEVFLPAIGCRDRKSSEKRTGSR